ncbi:uncharacterized protein LOC129800452 isoform X2 [Phlebotomus papatasi]|uniref:uncharacterized protein LOC129800452 isoform X2 n=1 Tax=Phlebotomus papatasi TaxID=29031 RepID=UPI00248414FD|nr:uncharacterized protein LOC129800452 isoform X2 [Phlebotomus papatasi]
MPHAWWLVISLSVFVTCNPTTLRPLHGSNGKYSNKPPLPPIFNTLSDVQKYPPSEYTEQIFLPIAAKNYHPQKTHETLSREPKEFDLLNFSAYTVRPMNISRKLPWNPRKATSEEEVVTDNPKQMLKAQAPPKDFPAPSYVTFYGKILPRLERLTETTTQYPQTTRMPLKTPRPMFRRSMKNHYGNYEYPTSTPRYQQEDLRVNHYGNYDYQTSTPRYRPEELRATKQTDFYGDVEIIHPTVGRAKDVDRARLVKAEEDSDKNQKYESAESSERDLVKKILYDDVFYHPEVKKKQKRKTQKLLASYNLPIQHRQSRQPQQSQQLQHFKKPYKKPNDGDYSYIVFPADKKKTAKSGKLKNGLNSNLGKKKARGVITNTTKVYYNFEHTHEPNTNDQRNAEALASDYYETTLPNPDVSDTTEKYSSKYRTPKWINPSDERESSGQQRNPPFLPTVLTPLVRIEKPNTDEYSSDYDLSGANSDQKSEKQKNDDVQQYFQFAGETRKVAMESTSGI